MKTFLFAVASLLLACSSPQNGSNVAARVGDRTITVQELDERWRTVDPGEQTETIQKLYDGRRNATNSNILFTEERDRFYGPIFTLTISGTI